MDDKDEIEYRYVKGSGWVAGYEDKPKTHKLYMPYDYAIEPGMMISGSNGIVGRVISYKDGLATIILVDAIEQVTITGTISV